MTHMHNEFPMGSAIFLTFCLFYSCDENLRHLAIIMQKQFATNVRIESIAYATGDEFIEQCHCND